MILAHWNRSEDCSGQPECPVFDGGAEMRAQYDYQGGHDHPETRLVANCMKTLRAAGFHQGFAANLADWVRRVSTLRRIGEYRL